MSAGCRAFSPESGDDGGRRRRYSSHRLITGKVFPAACIRSVGDVKLGQRKEIYSC